MSVVKRYTIRDWFRHRRKVKGAVGKSRRECKKEKQVFVCNRCEWTGDAVVEFCPTCGQDGSFTYLRRYTAPIVPRTLRCAECSELLAPSELEVCSECQLEGLR